MENKKDSLLLIHGVISDSGFFDGCRGFLEDRYHVMAYDRRCYGEDGSRPEDTDCSVKAQAGDAAQILLRNGAEPSWVLGYSAGAMIALELCLHSPHLVKGLVLMEPSLALDPLSQEQLDDWNRELNGYVQSGRIKKALPAFSRVIGGPANETAGGMKQGSIQELKRTYKNLAAFMHGELNEVQKYRPSAETLRTIRRPVTVIVSSEGKDNLFGQTSQRGAAVVPWEVREIPGYHNAAAERPEEFAYHLIHILEEMAGAAKTII